MKVSLRHSLPILLLFSVSCSPVSEIQWSFGDEDQVERSDGVAFSDGLAVPEGDTGTVLTALKSSDRKRSANSLTIQQSPVWHNWNPIENLGPSNLQDAPVLLTMGPGDYWIFGRYGSGQPRRKKGEKAKPMPKFVPAEATLEGFEVPLKTTRFPNVFDAPGGLKPSQGGYHAWQSRDMKSWVHHGPVTEQFSRWVTSAEMVDGRAYIYYDFPNDQDPHVYVDSDLTDGEPGENRGLAVADPSHGSDAGFIRDLDGKMHVIIEDWSPINASKRSWDSPLAGHAVSEDGLGNFVFGKPAVDQRTKPTGEKATYNHPHWAKEDPDNYETGEADYEIHEPEQEAYGDWAAIAIGGQYYLFADYDPEHGAQMSTAWFTSSDISEEFTFCDHIGEGHPDPDVAFANGQFYLATQQQTDWVSPGPWVDTVEVRVGVDTDKDGKADEWSEWAEVSESYDYIEGFSKQISKSPAALDLSDLPAGYGFQVEMKLTDSTENKSKPMIERLSMSFE
ncbi:MAG: hypothetical protein P1U58_01270 [Verrucomicrobiales bacterium]|nr:hypothetical protein [Verrucomicrobiales bacterium]